MKEIEIRANALYPILHKKHPENRIKNAQFQAYVKGATEQRAIDDDHLREVKKMAVDKVREWFQYNAWSFGNYAQGDSSYEWEMAFECFLKAMEEEV